MQEDWNTVLGVLSKQKPTPEAVAQYVATQGVRYISAEVLDVAAEGDVGFVAVAYTAGLRKFPDRTPRSMQRWELWRRSEAAWSPVPELELDKYPTLPKKAMSGPDLERLTRRCREDRDARTAQDAGAIYDRLDPAFRERMPRDEFLKRKSQDLIPRYSFDWVEVIENRGRVRVTYWSKPSDPLMSKLDPRDSTETDVWTKVDGEWYHVVDAPRANTR